MGRIIKKRAKRGLGRNTRSGAVLESCREQLVQHEFEAYETNAQFIKAQDNHTLSSRYFVHGFAHDSIYGTPGKKELYIFDYGDETVVEAKFQNGSGSVDEKFPFVFDSFLASPIKRWVLVYDGNWWQESRGAAAIRWAKAQQYRVPSGKEWLVLSRRDFALWVKGHFSGKQLKSTDLLHASAGLAAH